MPRLQSTNLPHTHSTTNILDLRLFLDHTKLTEERCPKSPTGCVTNFLKNPAESPSVPSLLASSTGAGQGIAGPFPLPQKGKGRRRKADCMGHAPFSRGLHSKRLILPLKGEIHDLFGLGMGNFWNPESGFPCAGQGREIVWGTRPQKGLPGVPGLRAGFGLGHSSRTPHSGQYALLCLRVGSTTQPSRGRPTHDSEGSPRPSRVKLKTESHAREIMPPPFPVPLTHFRETNTFLPRKGAWKGSIYCIPPSSANPIYL